MKTHTKLNIKIIAIVSIFALTILASCSQATPVTACHATGDLANPYEQITIDSTETAREHLKHANDIYPVPEGGCPTTLVVVDNSKITICHATDNESTPYNEISVSINGLNGHGTHAGDIIPAPEGGCPTSPLVIVDGMISICHATGVEETPYEEISVHVNGLDGHFTHNDDIVPAPMGGCPTTLLAIVDGKVTICHATSSETNPYNEITVSVNGLNGHDKHEGDIIPAPESGCPNTEVVETVDEKITICHMTGSEKHPYNLITISVNGLNGHNNHTGDIIPAPAAGCPATKQ